MLTKALTLAEYRKLYPQEDNGLIGMCEHLSYPGCVIIRGGLLQFTEDSACNWGGPFEGGYCVFRLQDYTNAISTLPKYKGKNVLDIFVDSVGPVQLPLSLKTKTLKPSYINICRS